MATLLEDARSGQVEGPILFWNTNSGDFYKTPAEGDGAAKAVIRAMVDMGERVARAFEVTERTLRRWAQRVRQGQPLATLD